MLLVRERFDDGDPGFLTELFGCRGTELKAFGIQWGKDPRPFARQTLLRYVNDGCDRPGHRVLVKKLFKDAEDRGDDELMRHFMVAFDRLIVSRVIEVDRWSWQTREIVKFPMRVYELDGATEDRFSIRTRRYLQRRVYRYFRRIGYRDRARYVRNLIVALGLYADEDRDDGSIDRWSLFHALYWGSRFARRHPSGVTLMPGRRLSHLNPAPQFPDEWRRQTHLDALIQLAAGARNADVRGWVRGWLESDPARPLEAPSISRVAPLLRSPYVDAQEWSAELLPRVTDLATQSVATWVELMTLPNDPAAEVIARLAGDLLSPDRLSLDLAVQVAIGAQGPVATLALGWIQQRPVVKADVAILVRLAQADHTATRSAAVDWLTVLLGQHRSVLLTRELLDSPHVDVRARILDLIQTHYAGEAPLATALFESPFPDVRNAFVSQLEGWIDRLPPDGVHHLWARTLLSVRNGGRAKQAALRQLVTRTLKDDNIDTLPLLAIALRSVRAPERRGALAAIARIVHARQELAEPVRRAIPELTFEGIPA